MANGGWELQDVKLKPGEDHHEEVLARHDVDEMTAASTRDTVTLRLKSHLRGGEPVKVVVAVTAAEIRDAG
jgi:hypothetical protein